MTPDDRRLPEGRNWLIYPVFYRMEGARVFKIDKTPIEETKIDNKRLSRHLDQSHIAIDDIPHTSPTNPVRSTHNPVR